MAASSFAGIVTAIAAVFTAIGGVIAALTLLVPILRQTRAVHVIVNQQHTNMRNYQRALIRELEANSIAIPVDQSSDNEG